MQLNKIETDEMLYLFVFSFHLIFILKFDHAMSSRLQEMSNWYVVLLISSLISLELLLILVIAY